MIPGSTFPKKRYVPPLPDFTAQNDQAKAEADVNINVTAENASDVAKSLSDALKAKDKIIQDLKEELEDRTGLADCLNADLKDKDDEINQLRKENKELSEYNNYLTDEHLNEIREAEKYRVLSEKNETKCKLLKQALLCLIDSIDDI